MCLQIHLSLCLLSLWENLTPDKIYFFIFSLPAPSETWSEKQHHADWSYFQCVTTSLKWTLVQPSNPSVFAWFTSFLLSCYYGWTIRSPAKANSSVVYQILRALSMVLPPPSLSWCSPLFWIIPISIQLCYYLSIFKKIFPTLPLSSNYRSQVSVTIYLKIHQKIVYTHCFHHLPFNLKGKQAYSSSLFQRSSCQGQDWPWHCQIPTVSSWSE